GDGRGFAQDPHRARYPPFAPRRARPSRGGELLVSARELRDGQLEEAAFEPAGEIFARAAQRAGALGLRYAGAVTPHEAWQLQPPPRRRLALRRAAVDPKLKTGDRPRFSVDRQPDLLHQPGVPLGFGAEEAGGRFGRGDVDVVALPGHRFFHLRHGERSRERIV